MVDAVGEGILGIVVVGGGLGGSANSVNSIGSGELCVVTKVTNDSVCLWLKRGR